MHLYSESGVNIKSADEFVNSIKTLTDNTKKPEVLSSIGSFAGLVDLGLFIKKYRNPVLVSSTDGVGSKLLLAQKLGKHTSIGIDLVAMCVNDIIVHGAEPVYFLDYMAVGKLDKKVAYDIVSGISEGCIAAGMSLIGGETAELPGVYDQDKYDLAGFAVGIAEKENLLPGKISEGDTIIGLKSSGVHSNGFSLVSKMLKDKSIDLFSAVPFDNNIMWGELLLEPTKIYVNHLASVSSILKGAAHITGGGISGNLPRILCDGLVASIDTESWEIPEIFNFLAKSYNLDTKDLLSVFNCGIGMILIVAKHNVEQALYILGDEACRIGTIEKSDHHKKKPGVLFFSGDKTQVSEQL